MFSPHPSVAAYVRWVADAALPAWAERGVDADGRFRERLDARGAPVAVPHRAMVQARQIYVYAHAALAGWFPGGGVLAERAMRALVREYGDVGPGHASFAFSRDPHTGRVVSAARDAYTHAFVLFAAAWLHRLTGDRALLTLAEKTRAFVRARLVDPRHGGVFDALDVAGAVPDGARDKRQNPLMHLLEAYLALERAAPGRGFLDDAAAIVALFRRRLYDAPRGVLLEHFAEDWAPHPAPARADAWEPGHHFEWVWLLAEYDALAGDDTSATRGRLYAAARARGVAPSGLVYDELGADGRVRQASHRVWPHTEGIKAAVARAADGDPDAPAFGGAMADALLAHFLDRPFPGGWVDHRAPDGRPLADYAPASTLYHLFFAAAEAARPRSA